MMKIKHSTIKRKIAENDEERLTDDIELLKQKNMISKSDI